MADETDTAPADGAHAQTCREHALRLLDAIDEVNRGLNLLRALQMAVGSLDGTERAGLAELADVLRRTVCGGLDMVDEVRRALAAPS
ncbi:MAG: hypothetical protein ACFE0R_11910 [Salinarimonas sp.]